DYTLVSLSIMVAIVAAYISIDLLEMYLSVINRSERIKWHSLSAMAMGIGIWVMHFIGMFAYELPITVHYDGLLTIASLLIAMAACFIGIGYIRRSVRELVIYGGLFMGAGIASMHYLGMYAMHMPAGHSYNSFLVDLSVIVAIVISSVGLLMVKNIHETKRMNLILLKLQVAVVFGLAVSSMHYLGMAAMTHVAGHVHEHALNINEWFIVDSEVLMFELVAGGMVLLIFSFYAASSEKKSLHKLKKERQLLRNSEKKLSTLLESIADAVITIDDRGRIRMFNFSAEQMFGYKRDEVIGKNVSILMTSRDSGHHDAYMSHYMETGKSKIIDVGTRQLVAMTKHGTEILIGLSINEVQTEGGREFVGVIRDMTEHRRELEKLTERADYDALTGLVNRHKLFAQLEHAVTMAKRNDTKVCFMFVDLDGFKKVNDDLGHDAGDELLKQVAVMFRDKTRESDVIARFGGDEFCIFFEGVKGCEGMLKLADKLIAAFKSPFHLEKGTVNVTASIGIAFYPDDAETDGELVRHADDAMYEAKKAGKNQYRFFHKECS
ncbi:MAG: diguanylate cyclase, partial [Gammaproteobacteria bacterium]|nr:diguanylate cyclase [Gammaproteobacteria bacterium]